MHIDPFTVLFFGLLVKVLLGFLFLWFWARSKRETWFAWWSATFLVGALSSGLFLRGFEGEFSKIGIAVLSVIAAFACCWQGARSFERRTTQWLWFFAAPAIWLIACFVPGFLQNLNYRITLSSLLLASLSVATGMEFWRGRDEPLLSRWAVIVLFVSLTILFIMRIPLSELSPFPFGVLPTRPTWLAAFNIILFFHTVTLALLIVALSKERLELRQRNRAQIDPLTGAMNRRALMSKGRRVMLRHERGKLPLCLLFLDLDNFKLLNDRYGHSGGDDVLTKFVAVVAQNIRPDDFLFRMGGEEFCCLLPHTETEQAAAVAERIRSRFESETVTLAGTPVQTTVSIGIASARTFGYDHDILVRRADAAAYAAKRQGRNKVVIATLDNISGADGRVSFDVLSKSDSIK